MSKKRIAIVGNINPNRTDEIQLNDIEEIAAVAERIGLELARAGFHIVVYSADEGTLEVDIVRGYASYKEAEPSSIHVIYSANSPKNPRPKFAQATDLPYLFNYEPDPDVNWVTSFYQSIMKPKVDGILLLGGGRATLITGLIAAGHNKAILAIGRFGGAAKQVWGILSQQGLPYIKTDHWNQLGLGNWTEETPQKLVSLFHEQFDLLDELKARETAAQESIIQKRLQQARTSYDKTMTHQAQSRRYALIAVPLLLFIVGAWIASQSINEISPFWLYTLLGLVPIAGGIVGSSARILLSQFQGNSQTRIPQMSLTLTLGLIAGVISAFIFLGAQVSSLSTLDLEPSQLSQQLKPLVLYTVLVSLAGGFALDAVYARLRDIDPEKIHQPTPSED